MKKQELRIQWKTIATAGVVALLGLLAYLTEQKELLAICVTAGPFLGAQLRQAFYFVPVPPTPAPPPAPEPEIPVDVYLDPSERPTEPSLLPAAPRR